MKTTLCTLIIIIATSCAARSEKLIKNKYLMMNDLWIKKAFQEEVISVLGPNFNQVDGGITYLYTNSKLPEMALFFDHSNKLIEQFAMINEESLANLKKDLRCSWNETEEVKMMSHYSRVIKKGSCKEHSITYEFVPDFKLYEVRWKIF